MIRQRLSLRTRLPVYVVRLLTVAFAIAICWYGAMIVLLAVKVSPHSVNDISGYRTFYHDLTGLTKHDFNTGVRLLAGFGGLLVFLVFLYLAYGQIPRPYLTRSEVTLEDEIHGMTSIKPRAIERVAEIAARAHPNVTGAAGRLGNSELHIDIRTSRASSIADTLTDVRSQIAADLDRHDLPTFPVHVTLTGYDRTTKRELS